MKVRVTRSKRRSVSSHLPSPQLCSVHPGHLQSKEGSNIVRPEETLLPPGGPFHLLGVYPGCLPAPRRPVAVRVGPGACWSEHQPEAGPPDQTALKSGKQKH